MKSGFKVQNASYAGTYRKIETRLDDEKGFFQRHAFENMHVIQIKVFGSFLRKLLQLLCLIYQIRRFINIIQLYKF